jgi:hypothetical protein
VALSCRLSDALHGEVCDTNRANIAMPSWPDFSTILAGDNGESCAGLDEKADAGKLFLFNFCSA